MHDFFPRSNNILLLQLRSSGSVILPIRSFSAIPDNVLSKKWTPYRIELADLQEGDPPSFVNMKRGVLYYPGGGPRGNRKFPLCDFLYLEENTLVLIQVSRELGNRSFDITTMKKLYTDLSIPEDTLVKYIYSPLPRRSEEAGITFGSLERIGELTPKRKDSSADLMARISTLKKMKDIVHEKWKFFIAKFPDTYKLELHKKH